MKEVVTNMDMKKADKANKVIRCRHCGGPMRFYRDGINCLMCGRGLEHSCDRCRQPEKVELPRKKVA